MSADHDRPRPQYGEYATPEVQRARMGLPEHAEATAGAPVAAGNVPEHGAVGPGAVPHGRIGHGPDAPRADAPPVVAPRRWDLSLTWGLLAFGLFTVAVSVPAFLRLPQALSAAYSEAGVGVFSATDLARAMGVVLIIMQALVWSATAFASVRALHRGRLSFWIPLLGGVLSYLLVLAGMAVVLLNDPGFLAYVKAGSGA